MADVVLAEADGNMWLVLGEEHLGSVLMGEMPQGVTMEIAPVANRAAAMALWWRLNDKASAATQPWVVNPAFARRLHRLADPGQRSISFTPWSAALDSEAQDAIAAMAEFVAEASGTLLLRQYAPDEAVPGHADLQRLRLQLVRAALERAGVAAARMTDEVQPGTGAESGEQMDIVAGEPAL